MPHVQPLIFIYFTYQFTDKSNRWIYRREMEA